MASLFRLLRTQYTPPTETTASFHNKTVLLTGATSGLGFEAALKLLNLGVSQLIIGSRSLPRGQAAQAELERRSQRRDVIRVWELEMGSFQSVRRFAGRVGREVPRVDVALLNAGLWNRDYAIAGDDGWEEVLQVNVLSTALLAVLLLPVLRGGAEAGRLTIVSSQQFVRVKGASLQTEGSLLEHLNDPARFNGGKQYGISKLLVEYVAKSLADMVRNEDGTLPVIVNTVSPGLCVSSLGRQYDRFYERWVVWVMYKLFARTTEQGSRSLVSATYQGVESHGKCWRSDGYLDESAALTVGEEGRKFREKAWREIGDVLRAQAEEVEGIIGK